MYQAIDTKFYGPTNFKGSRIRARCQAKKIWVSWDHGLGVDENHTKAAKELIKQLGWDEHYWIIGGGDPDSTGNYYVLLPKDEQQRGDLINYGDTYA